MSRRISLSDRTEAKPRPQQADAHLLLLTPPKHQGNARGGPAGTLLLALGWRAEPQNVVLASPGKRPR